MFTKHFEKPEVCDICGKPIKDCYVSGGIYRCKTCMSRYIRSKKQKKVTCV